MRATLVRIGAAFAAPLAAIGIAACGSTTKPPVYGYADALKFSNCMRSHGVPQFPDPSSGGGLKLVPGSGLDPFSPSFRSAQQACRKFAPPNPGPVSMSESQRRAAVKFAECMRSHGAPNFPDPTLKPPTGGTPVLALRGMFFPLGSGDDPRSPAFKQAARACGFPAP